MDKSKNNVYVHIQGSNVTRKASNLLYTITSWLLKNKSHVLRYVSFSTLLYTPVFGLTENQTSYFSSTNYTLSKLKLF